MENASQLKREVHTSQQQQHQQQPCYQDLFELLLLLLGGKRGSKAMCSVLIATRSGVIPYIAIKRRFSLLSVNCFTFIIILPASPFSFVPASNGLGMTRQKEEEDEKEYLLE